MTISPVAVNISTFQNQSHKQHEICTENTSATFESFVWQCLGYWVETINGDRVTCRQCKKIVLYTVANKSNMQIQKVIHLTAVQEK